jgi:hypothetical protein
MVHTAAQATRGSGAAALPEVEGNAAFGGENMVEERGHVKPAPAERRRNGFAARYMQKMQYKLQFVGSGRCSYAQKPAISQAIQADAG